MTTFEAPPRKLSRQELNEEIVFLKDYCGWSDRKVEEKLDLAVGTLEQRKRREVQKRMRK